MSDQQIINGLFSVVFVCFGWYAREMWSAVKDLKQDLAKLREQLPREYVPKDDYRADIKELKEMLTRVFDRLDDKADK